MASSKRARRIRRHKMRPCRYFDGGKRSKALCSIKYQFTRKQSGRTFSANDLLRGMGSHFADRVDDD